MTTRPDPDLAIAAWLQAEAPDRAPERLLSASRDRIQLTQQRRAWWPARRVPTMNALKLAIAAAAVVVVAVIGLSLLPKQGGVGGPGISPTPRPSSTPSAAPSLAVAPSPTALPSASNVPAEFPFGPIPAGTYTVAPFTSIGQHFCAEPPQAGCSEDPRDDGIRVSVTVPKGWEAAESSLSWAGNDAPDGAGLMFHRGGWLLTDPCQNGKDADIRIGPTVADFVDAVAKHPILDTTKPVDVKLSGYSGKYFDLQVPADISKCDVYRPWEPGIYAQGVSERWHLWVLDVDGVRVIVQGMDYAGTPAQRLAEVRAMVDSLKIES